MNTKRRRDNETFNGRLSVRGTGHFQIKKIKGEDDRTFLAHRRGYLVPWPLLNQECLECLPQLIYSAISHSLITDVCLFFYVCPKPRKNNSFPSLGLIKDSSHSSFRITWPRCCASTSCKSNGKSMMVILFIYWDTQFNQCYFVFSNHFLSLRLRFKFEFSWAELKRLNKVNIAQMCWGRPHQRMLRSFIDPLIRTNLPSTLEPLCSIFFTVLPEHVAGAPTSTVLRPGTAAGSRTLSMALPRSCSFCSMFFFSSLSFLSLFHFSLYVSLSVSLSNHLPIPDPPPFSLYVHLSSISPSPLSTLPLSLPGGSSRWPSTLSLVLLEVSAC